VRVAAATTFKPGKDERKLTNKECDAVDRLVQSLGAEPLYWSRLEQPFRFCLAELADAVETQRYAVIKRWYTEVLRRQARAAYQHTAGTMENSSRALRAAVTGEERLDWGFRRIENEYQFGSDTTGKEMDEHARSGS
jgi:hypothetical protein